MHGGPESDEAGAGYATRSEFGEDQLCQLPLIREGINAPRRAVGAADVQDEPLTALAHIKVLAGEEGLVAHTRNRLVFGLRRLGLSEL